MNSKGITLAKTLVLIMIGAAIIMVIVPWVDNLFRRSVAQEMVKTMKTYYTATDRFMTEKSYLPISFADLDVQMPDAVSAVITFPNAQDAVKIKSFYYYFFPKRKAIFASYGDGTGEKFYGFYIEDNTIYCFGKKGLPYTKKMCDDVMGAKLYKSTEYTDTYLLSQPKKSSY